MLNLFKFIYYLSCSALFIGVIYYLFALIYVDVIYIIIHVIFGKKIKLKNNRKLLFLL